MDWSIGELAAGLKCYEREEFFDAHEHWENIWRQSQGPEKPFLQALIQVAGALHHYRRRNLRGCQALLLGAMRRLEPYPERFGGVLLGPLRQELAAWLLALETSLAVESSLAQEPVNQGSANWEANVPSASGAPEPAAGPICFPESYPKIHLGQGDSGAQYSENQGDSDHGDSQE